MSRTLALFARAWTQARQDAQIGRSRSALRTVTAALATTHGEQAERAEAHRLAASLHSEAGRQVAARRHLRAALRLEPDHAATRFQLGQAFQDDPFGSDDRAMIQFAKAVRQDAQNPTYWAALARTAVRCDRSRLAVRAARRAAALAPANAAVLGVVLDALRELGRLRTARRLITQARFQAPRDSAITALWDRVRFDTARAEQRPAGRRATVLPFLRVIQPTGQTVVVRRDTAHTPVPRVAK